MTQRSRRIAYWLIAIAAVAALAIPKILLSRKDSASGGTAGQNTRTKEVAVLTVNAHVVGKSSLDDRISVTGTVLPNEQVDIQSEITGKVAGIFFKEGNAVA